MHVCVPAHLSSSRSLFPSTCPHSLSLHTVFSTPQTQGFLGRPEQGLIYCTVELWEGKASQHKVADERVCQPLCWRWWCFMSPADGDDLSSSREKLWCARLWYALSPVWRSKLWMTVKKPRRPNSPVARRKRNKERRASVSSAALRTVLWLTVRSRWPGPTDVLGLSAGSGLDQLREHDT